MEEDGGGSASKQDPDTAGPRAPDDLILRLSQQVAQLSAEIGRLTNAAGARQDQLEFSAASAVFRSMASAYSQHPEALADAQLDLFGRQSDVLRNLSDGTEAPEADADPRFSDAMWRQNPFFDFLRRTFLATSDWAQDLAWNAPGLTEQERRRAAFFLRQATAAHSPSNLLMANPRALQRLLDTSGASLEQGLQHMQVDLSSRRSGISVQQTDRGAFQLGVDLASTPGEVVFCNSLIELIRYHPSQTQVAERPLLIFPPWINKYYVLDLTEQNSLVRWLRDQGFTVYITSWRSADDEIANYGWDQYFKEGAIAALDWVSGAHQTPVSLAGYCVGGALAAILTSFEPERVASLSLLATQTDFSEPGDLGLFIDDEATTVIARVIAQNGGVMPGEVMRDAFNLLRPEDLIWRFVEERYLLGQSPRAFDLLFWNDDQTNLPGPLHLQSLKRLYVDNALAEGDFEIEGRKVDLGRVTAPVFVHAARRDHISPFESVYRGIHLFGGSVDFLLADSGHIAGVINPPAANKYRYWTSDQHPPIAEAWLEHATEHPGSWWPIWGRWLEERSGGKAAPPPVMPEATPAPGFYVRETLDGIRTRRGL